MVETSIFGAVNIPMPKREYIPPIPRGTHEYSLEEGHTLYLEFLLNQVEKWSSLADKYPIQRCMEGLFRSIFSTFAGDRHGFPAINLIIHVVPIIAEEEQLQKEQWFEESISLTSGVTLQYQWEQLCVNSEFVVG